MYLTEYKCPGHLYKHLLPNLWSPTQTVRSNKEKRVANKPVQISER